MNRAIAQTTEFLSSITQQIEGQTEALQNDFAGKLYGADYSREVALAIIFPSLEVVRPIASQDQVTLDDIEYSTWLIAELNGKLQAQIAHRNMQPLGARTSSYNYMLHACLVGTLRAELEILNVISNWLETRKKPTMTQSNQIRQILATIPENAVGTPSARTKPVSLTPIANNGAPKGTKKLPAMEGAKERQ